MRYQFTSQDLEQIALNGSTPAQVWNQIEIFREGVAAAPLNRACRLEDGILFLDEARMDQLIGLYAQAQARGRVTKFVPASGAASRMFKALHSAREKLAQDPDTLELDKEVVIFQTNLDRFAFAEELRQRLAERGRGGADLAAVLEVLLGEDTMNYGNKPKALLSFHRYPEGVRTPVQEHLSETLAYAADQAGRGRLHFTVSPEHLEAFKAHVAEASPAFEALGLHPDISYSVQHQSTDTIAVTLGNEPFRDQKGRLLFRPAGHGALIQNLADLDGDLIFIKNIDNVVPDHLKDVTIRYKRALGGLLINLQQQIFAYLDQLDGEPVDRALVTEIATYAKSHLGWDLPAGLDEREAIDFLQRHLSRPLRVCGMVRNEGEPGGGPFWVDGKDGGHSLQIVESSQIDTKNPEQAAILADSTHFNPVDLVCAVRDRHGRAFPLVDYVDPSTCFISEKSFEGRRLKALELPGLWNGAMAFWNTCFVEVPLATFNPVKTVNDLLRDQHQ